VIRHVSVTPRVTEAYRSEALCRGPGQVLGAVSCKDRAEWQRGRTDECRIPAKRGRPEENVDFGLTFDIQLFSNHRFNQMPGIGDRTVDDHDVGIQTPDNIGNPDTKATSRFRQACNGGPIATGGRLNDAPRAGEGIA